jgi:hypothetical protein
MCTFQFQISAVSSVCQYECFNKNVNPKPFFLVYQSRIKIFINENKTKIWHNITGHNRDGRGCRELLVKPAAALALPPAGILVWDFVVALVVVIVILNVRVRS